MTEPQLKQIETALGLTLPAEYRQVAATFPFRPIGRDWVYWFYDEPELVIEGTLAPLADGGYDQTGWRSGLLTIGSSAAGDLYVLDTTAAGLPVLCLDHETHTFAAEWPTFAAFVQEWLRAPEEIAAQTAAEAATHAVDVQRQMRLGWLILAVSLGLPLAAWILLWLLRH